MTVAEITAKIARLDERTEAHGEALERGRDSFEKLREEVKSLQAWRWLMAGGLAIVIFEIPLMLNWFLKSRT